MSDLKAYLKDMINSAIAGDDEKKTAAHHSYITGKFKETLSKLTNAGKQSEVVDKENQED